MKATVFIDNKGSKRDIKQSAKDLNEIGKMAQ